MKKKSKYRPKVQLQDPLNYVLNGFLPMSVASSTMLTLGCKNYDALAQCCKGNANYQFVDTLMTAFDVAVVLSELGIGAEYKDALNTAKVSMLAMSQRTRMVFTGPEMTAVTLGLEIHDAQLEDSRCTLAVMGEAVRILKRVEDIRVAARKQIRVRETA
jgi:hypothetical protein